MANWNRERYKNDIVYKEKERQRLQTRERKAREYIWEYKITHPCVRCGFSHPAALQFHHREPGDKEFSLSNMHIRSLPRIMKEIEKCDVLCANCHFVLHYESSPPANHPQ